MSVLKRLVVLFSFTLLTIAPSFGQDDIDQLLQGSIGDAQKLVGAYVSPVMKSTSLALNQGWYNTAKPHKIAGVDLTITINAMTIPSNELIFNVEDLNLQELELDPNYATQYDNTAPTIVGPDRSPLFRFKDDPTGPTFEGPPGLDLEGNIGSSRVPLPMAQIGFGLPKGTDLKLRFFPSRDFNGTNVKLFGIGVMHDIKQWIPGIKMLPFDLSAFVGHTKLEVNSKLDPDNANNADKIGSFSLSATTIQGVIGKKFSVLTVYGGLGYNIAHSNIAVKGSYDLDDDPTTAEVKDPVNLDFAASGFRASAGARLKLAVFTFHADYTLQEYNCLTVGFGISVR